jgi:Tfp pilus assembly protein PilV
MSDDALSGMVARLNDFEQRYEHDQLALQSMARQLEETKAERDEARAGEAKWRSAYFKDMARVQSERDTHKLIAQKMMADRTYNPEPA